MGHEADTGSRWGPGDQAAARGAWVQGRGPGAGAEVGRSGRGELAGPEDGLRRVEEGDQGSGLSPGRLGEQRGAPVGGRQESGFVRGKF